MLVVFGDLFFGDFFFFLLSRMSHLRMIPLADLANAALPGEANARIVAQEDGCGILAKGPVSAGSELCIDYNHRDAITMLCSYGCTLGLEKMVTVGKIKWMVPPHLHKIFNLSYLEQGVRLETKYECGFSEERLMQLRMSAFWSTNEYVEALKAGYFKPGGAATPEGGDEAKWRAWRDAEKAKLGEVAAMCEQTAEKWDARVGPPVAKLREAPVLSWIGRALVDQHETDLGLFTALAVRLRAMQKDLEAAEGTGDSGGKAGGEDSKTPSDSILYELN